MAQQRATLPTEFRPGNEALFMQRVAVPVRAGRLTVITAGMRQRFAAVTIPHRVDAGLATIGDREAIARGVEVGFYRDMRGNVRHVQDERYEIIQDAATLDAADHGLVALSDTQRSFMERRLELLERFDATVDRRRVDRPSNRFPDTI